MKPGDLSAPNNKLAEVPHRKRESDEKSIHLQVLQILHILCFTDVNSETEKHFFLVEFLNSTIYEPLVKFGPIRVEIKLVKPIKFTLLPHVNHAHSQSDHQWLFYQVYERFIVK